MRTAARGLQLKAQRQWQEIRNGWADFVTLLFATLEILIPSGLVFWLVATHFPNPDNLDQQIVQPFGFLSAIGVVIGGVVLVLGTAFLAVWWSMKGHPIPSRGLQGRREQRRAARALAAAHSKLQQAEATELEKTELRQRYVRLGEQLAQTEGANTLWATVHAHEALDTLVTRAHKVANEDAVL